MNNNISFYEANMDHTEKVKKGSMETTPLYSDKKPASSLAYTPEYYTEQAFKNVQSMSRTMKGIIDTSASIGKKDIVVSASKSEIQDTAKNNFQNVLNYLLEKKEKAIFNTLDLKNIILYVAKEVSSGILKDSSSVFRKEDSDKYQYTPSIKLEKCFDDFTHELFSKMNQTKVDPIELAAWVEWKIDIEDHYFADGCGKTSKAISTFVLARYGFPLPIFRGREEFYTLVNNPDTRNFKDFLAYYRTLF